jgi:predicted short-subunit dehydrogenase-like oxidoreductase (DUF2520 family)
MNIGLIGCGKVGTTIFFLLKKSNNIVGVYDINKRHERRTLRLLQIKKNRKLRELCRKSDALFFATPDDRISDAYTAVKPYILHVTYIYHFSGFLPSTVFPRFKYTRRASVHPFATFPEITIPPARKQYPLFIEGNTHALRKVHSIFQGKHFTIHKLRTGDKTLYHLAGVFSSNLLVGLVSATYEICGKFGWGIDDINEFIIPIIKETVTNIQASGIKKALSGPIERGDAEVVKKHLKTLKKNKHLSEIYATLSRQLIKNQTHGRVKKNLRHILQNIKK